MLQLYIGNKNYSSWSLRPWLLMKHTGIGFEERLLRLSWDDASPFKKTLLSLAPSGRVPLLVDDGFATWPSPSTWPSALPTSTSGPPTRRRGPARAASAPRCTPASPSCATPSA